MRLLTFIFLIIIVFTPPVLAQSVTYEVDIDRLFYSEPGCGDQSGTPDPVWMPRVNTNGAQYDWKKEINDIPFCGWQANTYNYSFTPSITSSATNNIVFSFNGYEDDGWFADDAVCGNWAVLRTIDNICDYPPYTWNYFIDSRNCTSDGTTGEYRVEWSYYWRYNEAPPIVQHPAPNTVVCNTQAVNLSVEAGTDACGRNMGLNYQWQYSLNTDCNGATNWITIPGSNSPNLTIPAGSFTGTRVYRCLITSNNTSNFTTNTAISNCAQVTVNPMANPPAIISSVCGGTVLPGTSYTLSTLQPPAVGAVTNIDNYEWSATGGTFSPSSSGANLTSVTWTAPNTPGSYTITVEYQDACGNVISADCQVNVAESDCDFTYVSPSGTDNVGCGGPGNPCRTLTGSNGALVKNKKYIRMAIGNYTEPNIAELTTDMVVEGRYIQTGSTWTKSSSTANSTTLTMSGEESVSGVRHRMGFKSDGVENWRLIDLNITTTNITTRDLSGRGASNYGVWINNSSNYEVTRCRITSGNAGNGANGTTPANGGGGIGGTGGAGGTANKGCGNAGLGGNGLAGSGGVNAGAGAVPNAGLTTPNPRNNVGDGCCNYTRYGSVGKNGANGGNGPSWAVGNRPTAPLNSSAYYTPPLQAASGTDGGGGAGGSGGGGSSGGQHTFMCLNCDGRVGGRGGRGGDGGRGGTGGFGGGGTFAIWKYNSNTGASVTHSTLTTGDVGVGGNGANGSNANNSQRNANRTNGVYHNTCYRDNISGDGGNGGYGGNGGRGRDGANGLSAQMVTNGTASSPSTSIPNSPIVQINYENSKICSNSIVEIEKSSGNWGTLPSNWEYVRYENDATASQFNNTSSPAEIATTNTTGYYNLQAGSTTFNSYLAVRENRPKPVVTIKANDGSTLNPAATICEGGTVQLTATSYGTEVQYLWDVYKGDKAAQKGGANPTPVFSSTLQSPITSDLDLGTYTVRYQVREQCCGWSVPVFAKIYVVEGPTMPLDFDITAGPVCEGDLITASSPTGVASGMQPYTYEWDFENDDQNYSGYSTSNPSFPAAEGVNKVRVRVQEDELRGCLASDEIEKIVIGERVPVAPTNITVDGSYCAGNEITLTAEGGALGTGTSYQWFSGSCNGTLLGTTSSNSFTLTTQNGATNYYVNIGTNACGASSCASIAINNPTPSNTLAHDGDVATCPVNSNNWVHFYNENGRLIASINSNGQNLGEVTAICYQQNPPITVGSCPLPSGLFTDVLGRRWVITPEIQPTSEVEVRLYYSQNEYDLLKIAANSNWNPHDDTQSYTDLKLTKFTGTVPGVENGTFTDNCGNGHVAIYPNINANSISSLSDMTSFNANGRFSTYSIPNFSEFWLHGDLIDSPLPVALTVFSVTCKDEGQEVIWQTASEQNSDYFVVERSRNGSTWEMIANIPAQGNSQEEVNYSYLDDLIGGTVYYRLKQYDYDGSVKQYGPITSNCEVNSDLLEVHPNPNDGNFTVIITSVKDIETELVLTDLTGRKINQKKIKILAGKNTFYFEHPDLSTGTYIISVLDENNELEPVKFVKK